MSDKFLKGLLKHLNNILILSIFHCCSTAPPPPSFRFSPLLRYSLHGKTSLNSLKHPPKCNFSSYKQNFPYIFYRVSNTTSINTHKITCFIHLIVLLRLKIALCLLHEFMKLFVLCNTTTIPLVR